MTLEADLAATAQVLIHKPAPEVFDAFAKAETMSRFWFTRHDDGLRAGETVTWYLGAGPDAPQFEVRVTSLHRPSLIVMEWENAGDFTTVVWTFEEKRPGTTVLRVEETGYTGDPQTVIAAALDSTGGFNQVLIAAKAWLEHRAPVNVVADHVAD
ncbi:MAG: SRPBCC domain-containing protein [Acidobacteria bacterium]|nr:SRPBCC domain-containing protein [Acidobacteriota bacterium]